MDAKRWNMLNPLKKQKQSYLEKAIAKGMEEIDVVYDDEEWEGKELIGKARNRKREGKLTKYGRAITDSDFIPS